MKPRFSTSVLLVVLFVLFWILWPKSPLHTNNTPPEPQPPQGHPALQTTPPKALAQAPNPNVGPIPSRAATNKLQGIRKEIGKELESGNVPLDFYGQTVDQDGNVLPGVHIHIVVRHWTASLNGTSLPLDRTSDANGNFDIHGVTGDGFDVESMTKEGYEFEMTHRGYGPVGGAPSTPIIFKFWRNDIKEPLVTGSKTFHLIPDGRLYSIDITNGIIMEGTQSKADLLLWVKRPEQIVWGKRFDWSCEMQTVGGGMHEAEQSDPLMYVAPQDGYSNSFHFDAGNGWPDETGDKHFFLQLKDGEYGRVMIDIYAYYNKQIPGLIRIQYAINPTGSRILRQ
jgi:hypothetical protein